MNSLCFGCWSREPCGCSAAWKTFCAYARNEKWRAVLPTLASNLRIAAGLTVSFELGRDLQHVLTNADWLETRRDRSAARSEAMRDYFSPGCNRPAPGWREG